MDSRLSGQKRSLDMQRPPKKRRVSVGPLPPPKRAQVENEMLTRDGEQSKGTRDGFSVLRFPWSVKRIIDSPSISSKKPLSYNVNFTEIDLDALTYYPPESEQSSPNSSLSSSAPETSRSHCQTTYSKGTKKKQVRFFMDTELWRISTSTSRNTTNHPRGKFPFYQVC